jgi:hypothetical protein
MLTTMVIAPRPNVTASPAICWRERTSFDNRGKGRTNMRTSEIMFMIQSTSNSFVFQKVHEDSVEKFLETWVPHQNTAERGAAIENETVMAVQT